MPRSTRRTRLRRPARRALRALVAAASLVVAASAPATAPARTVPWAADGDVAAVVVRGSTAYIGGSFRTVGPQTGSAIVADPRTGALRPGWPVVVGDVEAMVRLPDGGYVIGGYLVSVGGVPVDVVARITPGGKLDRRWRPALQPGGRVSALAVLGSTVYMAGTFTTRGASPQSGLAAFGLGRPARLRAWRPTTDGTVSVLAAARSVLFAGGFFTTVDGQTQHDVVALDPVTGAIATPVPEADGAVSAMVVAQPAGGGATDGTVTIAGSFTHVGGLPRDGLARFSIASGTVDGWAPSAGLAVRALARRDGTLFVGGFAPVPGGPTIRAIDEGSAAVRWTARRTTMRNVDALAYAAGRLYAGSNDGADRPPTVAVLDARSGARIRWDPRPDGAVHALLVDGAGVRIGGYFPTAGRAAVRRLGLAAIDTRTGRATAWNPGAVGSVYALALRGSTLYVGGAFSRLGGAARSRAGAVSLVTGRATAWAPSPDDAVYAIGVAGRRIVLGGAFTHVRGAARKHLAEVEAVRGRPYPWSPSVDGSVGALALAGRTVVVGGAFTSLDGRAGTANLAAVDALSGAPRRLPSPDGPVRALSVGSGTLYVAGEFTHVATHARTRVAAIGLASRRVTALRADADFTVDALATDGRSLYVAGGFARIAGAASSRLAAVSATTGVPRAWRVPVLPLGPYWPVEALALVPGGVLALGPQQAYLAPAAR